MAANPLASVQAAIKRRPEIALGVGGGLVLAVASRSRRGASSSSPATTTMQTQPTAVDGSVGNLAAAMSDNNNRILDLIGQLLAGGTGTGTTTPTDTTTKPTTPTPDPMDVIDGPGFDPAPYGGLFPTTPTPVPVTPWRRGDYVTTQPIDLIGPTFDPTTHPDGAISWYQTGRDRVATPEQVADAGITGAGAVAVGVAEQIAARTNRLDTVTTVPGTLSPQALGTLTNVNYELGLRNGSVNPGSATSFDYNPQTGQVTQLGDPVQVHPIALDTTPSGTQWSADAYNPTNYQQSSSGVADSRQFYDPNSGAYDWNAAAQARAAGLSID